MAPPWQTAAHAKFLTDASLEFYAKMFARGATCKKHGIARYRAAKSASQL